MQYWPKVNTVLTYHLYWRLIYLFKIKCEFGSSLFSRVRSRSGVFRGRIRIQFFLERRIRNLVKSTRIRSPVNALIIHLTAAESKRWRDFLLKREVLRMIARAHSVFPLICLRALSILVRSCSVRVNILLSVRTSALRSREFLTTPVYIV